MYLLIPCIVVVCVCMAGQVFKGCCISDQPLLPSLATLSSQTCHLSNAILLFLLLKGTWIPHYFNYGYCMSVLTACITCLWTCTHLALLFVGWWLLVHSYTFHECVVITSFVTSAKSCTKLANLAVLMCDELFSNLSLSLSFISLSFSFHSLSLLFPFFSLLGVVLVFKVKLVVGVS